MSPSEPSGADLLRLECVARRAGTGLVAGDLQGCWQLHQVWPKGGERPSSVSAALLRGLAARLEIRSSPDGLMLRNAVSLGPLELCFQGPGWLTGARPLLVFRFEVLELQLAGRTLLRRPLPAPDRTAAGGCRSAFRGWAAPTPWPGPTSPQVPRSTEVVSYPNPVLAGGCHYCAGDGCRVSASTNRLSPAREIGRTANTWRLGVAISLSRNTTRAMPGCPPR